MTSPAPAPRLEARLRDWAFRHGFSSNPVVVGLYRLANRVRFARAWEKPVAFRGASFVIGYDLSLFPAVRSGVFERDEFDWILPRIPVYATVWDVGANVGLHAVLMARAASRGEVIAFEPVDTTAARLVANLSRNAVDNVRVEQLALGDFPGEGRMRLFRNAPGCNYLLATGEVVDEDTRTVAVETADAYAARAHSTPDVIKVDIEGAEAAFVRGAKDIVERHKPLLMLEVNASTLRDDDLKTATWLEMIDFLFGVYGSAVWFGLDGPEAVTELDLDAVLTLPRAATIAFLGESD